MTTTPIPVPTPKQTMTTRTIAGIFISHLPALMLAVERKMDTGRLPGAIWQNNEKPEAPIRFVLRESRAGKQLLPGGSGQGAVDRLAPRHDSLPPRHPVDDPAALDVLVLRIEAV